MKVTIVNDRKALEKLCGDIKTARTELDGMIHTALVSALHHYIKPGKDGKATGDLTFLTMCAHATADYKPVTEDGTKKAKWDGRSVRGAAVRKWIEDFAGVRWSVAANDGAGGYRKSKSKDAVQPSQINIDMAMSVPFWQYTPDSLPTEVNPAKLATNLRAKLNELVTAGQRESKTTGRVVEVLQPEFQAAAQALIKHCDEFLSEFGKTTPDAPKAGSIDNVLKASQSRASKAKQGLVSEVLEQAEADSKKQKKVS